MRQSSCRVCIATVVAHPSSGCKPNPFAVISFLRSNSRLVVMQEWNLFCPSAALKLKKRLEVVLLAYMTWTPLS